MCGPQLSRKRPLIFMPRAGHARPLRWQRLCRGEHGSPIREPRCALLWRIDESYPNYAAIARAARRYDVKLRPVADGDLGGIVGDLCAGKPAPVFAPLIAVPDRPAIIVSGLRHDNGELGAFLDLIKMGGASIPVRSMVTPTSKGWTLANLLLELNTEHETVQGGNA